MVYHAHGEPDCPDTTYEGHAADLKQVMVVTTSQRAPVVIAGGSTGTT